MKNKKISSMLALGLAVAMMMTACGSTQSGTTSTSGSESTGTSEVKSSEASTEASSETQESSEPIVITWFTATAQGKEDNNNACTLFLEEKFNVDIQFVYASGADSTSNAYNLMLADGDLPDIIGIPFTAAQVIAGVEADALLPLNDYIVDGTNYKARLEENPEWEGYLKTSDGSMYTFMYTNLPLHKRSEHMMWYNVEWMEKLGWEEEPSTPEEFKQYLIDIRDNDVNGNGDPSDEIPLMGYYNGRKTDPIAFLMNPFELYTEDFHYITDDGEIHFSANTDGWRKGLSYIADLYSEGLIAEETYVQDAATFRSILNKAGKDALVGTTPGFYMAGSIDTSVMSWFSYAPLVPLKGDYQQTQATTGSTIFAMNAAITTACEHPEKAFEILDYLIGEEGSILGGIGVEGESYVLEDKENFLGTTPSIVPTYETNE